MQTIHATFSHTIDYKLRHILSKLIWLLTHWGRDQNDCHFANKNFKCIFLNENIWILIKISLKVVASSPIDNKPALVQIMAWHRPGDMPLSEPMLVSSLTHICVTQPQWVNDFKYVFMYRVVSRTESSQWETPLLCKDISHWLDASLESALMYHVIFQDDRWGSLTHCRTSSANNIWQI